MQKIHNRKVVQETEKNMKMEGLEFKALICETELDGKAIRIPLKKNGKFFENFDKMISTFELSEREKKEKIVCFATIADQDPMLDFYFNMIGFYVLHGHLVFQTEVDALSPFERLRNFIKRYKLPDMTSFPHLKFLMNRKSLRFRLLNKLEEKEIPSCVWCDKPIDDGNDFYELGDPIYLHRSCEKEFVKYLESKVKALLKFPCLSNQTDKMTKELVRTLGNDGTQFIHRLLPNHNLNLYIQFTEWLFKK